MDSSRPSGSNMLSDLRPPSPMLDTSIFSFSSQHTNDDRSMDEHQLPDGMETDIKPLLVGDDLSTSKDNVNSSMEIDEKPFTTIHLPPPLQPPQKRKCILDYFPWLNDVTSTNQQFLGSIIELKSTTILDGMDFLIGKLTDDYHEYYKSPKLAVALARYVRQFLYVYRYLYQSFELGHEYFRRMARLLAIYTDLELCSSVLGLELDADTANRIQLVYRTHLEFAEENIVLDVFLNMKRLCRGHRGILNLILQYFLVKITVQEPVELEDDMFIKYLIVFKKWLMVEEVLDDKENIRNAFITQVKPKKTLCMNISYAPYLPADEEGSATIDNYIRMLDKKYSLDPLIRALEISERNSMSYEELPSGIVRQISEVVILSDDEDETPVKSQVPKIKSEPLDSKPSHSRSYQSSSSMFKSSDLIDLTDEALDDADVPRHYISWLPELVSRAKIHPVTVDQRLEVAVISQDIIIIDDDETNNKPAIVDSNAIHDGMSKVVTHVDSPSSDSGCVIMNREEVGIIHSNSNFDISRCSSDTGVDDEEVALNNETVARLSGVANGITPSSEQIHGTKVVDVTNSNESTQTTTTSHHVSAGSNSSSCSEPAAEQLLTTIVVSSAASLQPPNCNELEYCGDSNVKSVTSVQHASTSRTAFDADGATNEIAQASSSKSNQTSVPLPKSQKIDLMATSSSISRMKQSQSVYVNHDETEIRRDAGISVRLEDDEDSFLMDVFGTKPIRPPTKNRVSFAPSTKSSSSSSSSASTIRVVHPNRHTYSGDWHSSRDDFGDDTNDDSDECNSAAVDERAVRFQDDRQSIPVWMPNSDRVDNEWRSSGSRTATDSTDRYISPYAKRTAILKASPSTQSHERSVRFADDVATNLSCKSDEDSDTPRRSRPATGKYDVPSVEETVPSTIQERKTYIKSALPSGSKIRSHLPRNNQPSSASSSPLYQAPIQPTHSSSSMHDVPASPYSRSLLHQTSSSAASQQQPTTPSYRVFYSGTELDLDFDEVKSSRLSDTCAPSKDVELTNLTAPSTASPVAFCESDNNLMLKLPAAIVHPLGVGTSQLSKHHQQLHNERQQLAVDEQSDTTYAGNTDESSELENMLQIFKTLKNRLEIMGYKPEDEASAPTSSGTKRLPSKLLEIDELYSDTKRESCDEIDEGDASLPFKKRRKLPVYSDTMELIKEEEDDSDSQPPFESESPLSIPQVEHEVEISSTSISSPPPPSLPPMQQPIVPKQQLQSSTSTAVTAVASIDDVQPSLNDAQRHSAQPPIARIECGSYPNTPMLSIANIVEYLPIRAYSTFKTPAPEIAPVRFNIVPQPTMVINNTPNPNTMGQPATAANNNSSRTVAAPAVNIVPPQPQMQATANASIGNQSAQSTNTACGIVTADAPPMQTIASDGSGNSFNVAQNAAIQYHRQTFHTNQPYTTTYSIQPTHQNTNNIPSNFDIQNMFNLHNYQMNPQNYHNLMQNSRINLQEKQAILLNDFVHSFDNNNPYDNTSHQQQQQQQQQHHQQQQQQQQQQQMQMHHMQQAAMIQSTNDANKNTICGLTANRSCTSAPRTKAARKMVSETSAQSSNVTSSSLGEKATPSTTTKTNRVTRSSNRTTRAAQNTSTMTEQKSPRRKTNRYK